MVGLQKKYVRARNLLILLFFMYPFIGLVSLGITYDGSYYYRAGAIVFFCGYALLLFAMLVRALRARIQWKRSPNTGAGSREIG
jgi:uncharacterized membrane protein